MKIWKIFTKLPKNHKIEKWKPLVKTGFIIIESHYLIFFENNCSRIHIPNPYLIVLSLRKRELPNLGLKPHTNNKEYFNFLDFTISEICWNFPEILSKLVNKFSLQKINSSRNFPKFSQNKKKKFHWKIIIHHVMVTSNCIIKWRAAQ